MTLVQTAQGNGGGYVNSYTLALGSNVTAGNSLYLWLACGAGDTMTITDNRSNSWNVGASVTLTSQRIEALFFVNNAAAGATTLTITFGSGQFNDSAAIVQEWSGVPTTDNRDQVATNTAAASATQSVGPTSNVALPNEIICFAVATDSSTPGITGDPSFAAVITQAGFDLYTSNNLQTKTGQLGTQSALATTSAARNSSMILQTFKPTTGSASLKNVTSMGNIQSITF